MLLRIDNLHVAYGAITALHDVSLRIDAGEVVTLIGANGAGKTTLLRTISGLIRPTYGSIIWDATGAEVAPSAMAAADALPRQSDVLNYQPARASVGVNLCNLPPHRIVHLGISHAPEGRQIFANMTVRENLLLGAYQRRGRGEINADLDRCYQLFPVLAERRAQGAGTLSGGEQQMLAIGRALMARPRLLLLDEPSLGLAPLIVRTIFDIIREISQSGTTIFLVEQNARMALRVAHRANVLQTGQVIKTDLAANLLEDPDVKKAYLGG